MLGAHDLRRPWNSYSANAWTHSRQRLDRSSSLIQPIASDDVARAVERIAEGPPVNGIVEVAGPERFRLDELIRGDLSARDDPEDYRVPKDVLFLDGGQLGGPHAEDAHPGRREDGVRVGNAVGKGRWSVTGASRTVSAFASTRSKSGNVRTRLGRSSCDADAYFLREETVTSSLWQMGRASSTVTTRHTAALRRS